MAVLVDFSSNWNFDNFLYINDFLDLDNSLFQELYVYNPLNDLLDWNLDDFQDFNRNFDWSIDDPFCCVYGCVCNLSFSSSSDFT